MLDPAAGRPAAFSYTPVLSDASVRGFSHQGHILQIDVIESRCARLAMDILVAEAFRQGDIGGTAEDTGYSLTTTLQSTDRIKVMYLRRKNQTFDDAKTLLSKNLCSAHILINERRLDFGLAPITQLHVDLSLPALSSHDKMRLQALDPDTLLPPRR